MTTALPDTGTIEHLDFETELPCEVRPPAKHDHAADLVVKQHGMCSHDMVIAMCWKWWRALNDSEQIGCDVCQTYAGPPRKYLAVIEVLRCE